MYEYAHNQKLVQINCLQAYSMNIQKSIPNLQIFEKFYKSCNQVRN